MTQQYGLPRAAAPLLTAALFLTAGPAAAQRPQIAEGACGADDQLVGTLGIDLSCDCTYTSVPEEGRWVWQFRTEPRITNVKRDGPSRGRLLPGDVIVAIDGMLITTARAGERLANLVPGRRTEITVRRNGREATVGISTDPRCRGVSGVAAVAPPYPAPPPAGLPPSGVRVSPLSLDLGLTGTLAPSRTTQSWFGFGLSCNECSLSGVRDEEIAEAHWRYALMRRGDASRAELEAAERDLEALLRGAYRWRFSSPPRLYSVDPGGPADRAGLRRGDILTHIDGHSLTSDEGGTRLARVEPGEKVRLVYRRGDAVRTATITPEEHPNTLHHKALEAQELARISSSVRRIEELTTEARVRNEAELLRGHLEAIRDQSAVVRRDSERAGREIADALMERERRVADIARGRRSEVAYIEARVLPLRYSGVIEDVDVVVRSRGSVVVTRDEGTGEVVITLSDAVIRMKPEKVKR